MQKAWYEIRTGLWRSFGLISSRSLPICIPLSVTQEKVDSRIFPERLRQPLCSIRGEIHIEDGVFFAEAQPKGFFLELSRAIVEEYGPPSSCETQPPLPVWPGCYICAKEGGIDISAIRSFLKEDTHLLFRSSLLVCLLIEIDQHEDGHLIGLTEQSLWEMKLRSSTEQ